MYEHTIGYKCENGEVIKVTGHSLFKESAYSNAIKELKSYPYFMNHRFDKTKLIVK